MGRREQPLDPADGPVARFAHELRKLREEAGGPTYRVMAGRVHYSTATLAQAAAGQRLPSLPVALAYVRACDGDVREWERRWREAERESLEAAAANDDTASPYLGLARFETDDHERFFGRDALADRLAELVAEHRLTLVAGPSGSGKSSLLRAGLVPRLRACGVPRTATVVTPGRDQDEVLTGRTTGDVLVVDQFEEVFTLYADAASRTAFIDALLALARGDDGRRVVVAVRADFFGHCAGHRELAEAVREATLLVSPMSPAELREAIVRPAATAGLIVERELTARIVAEVEGEPGALPLMSHALLETWRRRRGRALTTQAYEAAGGVGAAIARTSEELYDDLAPPQREHLRHLLLRLVTPGRDTQDTRRPVERAELLAGDADSAALLLERLARARLVTIDADSVELAHEALLTAWPRLRGWIEEDREQIRAQRRLTEAARAWEDHDRDPGVLYRGTRLAQARERFAEPGRLTPLEREFLTAGLAAHDRERGQRGRRRFALSALALLALVGSVLAWQESRAGEVRQRAADARRAVGVADSLRESDPLTAMRLDLAAWRLADLPETRSGLLTAAGQQPQDVFTDPDGATRTMRHLSADGRTLVSIGDARVVTWDVATHREVAAAPGLGALLEHAGVRQGDARMIPVHDRWGGVTLFDLATGRHDPAVLATVNAGTEMGAGGRTVIGYDTGESGHRIRVWDTGTRRLLLDVRLPGPGATYPKTFRWSPGPEMVRAPRQGRFGAAVAMPDATVSPDDRFMALCVPGERLQLWDIPARRRLDTPWAPRVTRTHCQYQRVRFSPDSRVLALVAEDGVRLWDVATGTPYPAVQWRNVREIGFSADGRFLAASDGTDLTLWRVGSSAQPVFRHALGGEYVTDLRVDPEADWIRYLAGPGDTWENTVRTLHLGRAATTDWQETPAEDALFSTDAGTLALVYKQERSFGHRFRLRGVRDGRLLAEPPDSPCDASFAPVPSCVPLMAFPSGNLFVYGSSALDQHPPPLRLSAWDPARRGVTGTYRLDGRGVDPAGAVAFAGAGSLVVADMPEVGVTRIWDLRRGTISATATGVTGHEIAVRPDRRLLVTDEGDVVDLPSGTRASGTSGPGRAAELAFSPDGAVLAAADSSGRTVLWDGGLTRRLGVLAPSDGPTSSGPRMTAVLALAFSPDGSLLAVAEASGVVRVWDVPSRRPLVRLATPGDTVLALAFDGETLYAAGEHVPLQRYDL
ncbi:MAG: hypothetical protein HOV97_16055, partial [Nonomuraea sp.]|nr:hypothetical protein [Nonomuraea sp.]